MSASVHAGIPPHPVSRHPLWEQTPPPRADSPRCRACWEIRSTRGRYASYWNAILFYCFLKKLNISSFYYRPQTKFVKVMFSQVSCPQGGLHRGGRAGRSTSGGEGVCIQWGGQTPPHRILRDTVNEWAVRILLECILVLLFFKQFEHFVLLLPPANEVCEGYVFTGFLSTGRSALGEGREGVCIQWGGQTPPPHRILRDTVNEWAVRILLECILVVTN